MKYIPATVSYCHAVYNVVWYLNRFDDIWTRTIRWSVCVAKLSIEEAVFGAASTSGHFGGKDGLWVSLDVYRANRVSNRADYRQRDKNIFRSTEKLESNKCVRVEWEYLCKFRFLSTECKKCNLKTGSFRPLDIIRNTLSWIFCIFSHFVYFKLPLNT